MSKEEIKHTWHRGSLQAQNAKMTPQQRDEARQRKDEGEPCRDLAQEYGVSAATIRKL